MPSMPVFWRQRELELCHFNLFGLDHCFGQITYFPLWKRGIKVDLKTGLQLSQPRNPPCPPFSKGGLSIEVAKTMIKAIYSLPISAGEVEQLQYNSL